MIQNRSSRSSIEEYLQNSQDARNSRRAGLDRVIEHSSPLPITGIDRIRVGLEKPLDGVHHPPRPGRHPVLHRDLLWVISFLRVYRVRPLVRSAQQGPV
ncbi:hypothetical protein N7453_004838 [Penicillium expansum]|nr:hypothetical protein N7453_004838 [Penicillium expansum]